MTLACIGVFGDRQGVRRPLTDHSGKVVFERYHDEYATRDHQMLFALRGAAHVSPASSLTWLFRQWVNFVGDRPYWLFGGSLLGQYCEEGLLRGDDDIDVAVLATDFYASIPESAPHGTMFVVRAGLHSDIIAAKFIDVASGRYIDVGLLHNADALNPKDLVHYWPFGRCPACADNPVRLEIPRSEIYPLQPCLFLGVNASCPRKVLGICKRMYRYPFYDCTRSSHP